MNNTILVTGIGGNVGQGVLRNIRAYLPNVKIVGTDIASYTVGERYCDKFYTLPYATDNNFQEKLINICNKESISLIIPTTDYESYYVGLLAEKLPTAIVSPHTTTNICLDKYLTFLFLKEHKIAFADSFLPSNYCGTYDKIIVKPREGRGSRNIYRNPSTLNLFDDTFIIQEELVGKEITTAFYVSKAKELHGHITFERKLENGMTSYAEVKKDYDSTIEMLLKSIIYVMPINGPCNIQSIVTNKGIVPFEINCRYSGSNSIRSQFGFEDVRYGIDEYLLGIQPPKPIITNGIAIRLYMDVIYKEQTRADIESGNSKSYIF